MSVVLMDVSKAVWVKGARKYLFRNVSLTLNPGQRVGILGQAKSGKSTLLQMLCGTEQPDSGKVSATSTVSWPIPLSDFLTTSSSVATNIRFVARLYGLKSENFVRRVSTLGQLEPFLNKKLSDCPRTLRTDLAIAMGLALERDIYLFDDKIAAGKEAKEKFIAAVKNMCPPAGLVLATGNDKEAAEICESVFVLDNAQLTYYADVKEGIARFKALRKPEEITVAEADDTPDATEADAMAEIGL